MSSFCRILFVFDRNLRLDNNSLLKACLDRCKDRCCEVMFLYVWDEEYLWPHGYNAFQANFLQDALARLRNQLQWFDANLLVTKGDRLEIIRKLIDDGDYRKVFMESSLSPHEEGDYRKIEVRLQELNGTLVSDLGNWLYPKGVVKSKQGGVFKKYSPFMKACEKLFEEDLQQFKDHFFAAEHLPWSAIRAVHEIGFGYLPMEIDSLGLDDFYVWNDEMLESYKEFRDFPWREKGTSMMGAYLRFGVVSIKRLAVEAWGKSRTMWNELVWREFFAHWYAAFPETAIENFDHRFDMMKWENDVHLWEKWIEGKTGYLMIDAGITSLVKSGYIHNRVRMVVASFLCKDLHMDWRKGEAFFARYLIDYDPASNVGNWQWVAGCGVDAAPYFRIFNPELQQDKFDANKIYAYRWLPVDYQVNKMLDHGVEKVVAMKLYDDLKREWEYNKG
ncbi:deoxyribodipyrimidine photo-lyase [Halosquirtibacter xylanolyticus]|uniref:cryptochrome/photolyase family protein n=1 Tax=Halosquirtibacter xylanolyticus TaxID=3374599 RepID=UPI00374A4F3E|nr:deoxyribodipyrimidine photo-lyase [Prolixibacteraceae bacterium]